MKTIWRKLVRDLGAFRTARAGNVVITFGLAALPIFGSVGFAIDYSCANAVKASLQTALDSTALMLSKDAATLSNSDLQSKAQSYFNALFTRPEAKNIAINAAYTLNGGSRVVVNGELDIPANFLGIVGYQNIHVGGSATAAWGSTRLRVALVLDNTGSMSSAGKMTALKTATKSLLAQLQGAASTIDDVYVSIIPFSKDVNVGGSSNYAANWIDWTDWDSDNKTCSGPGNYNCTPKNHNTWNGCITDRGQSNGPGTLTWDQVVTAPDGTNNSKWPADQYGQCPVQMMGLNNNWTAMNSLVNSMQPNGSTNQPIGLVWGWQSLVGGGPLTAPAMDSNYEYKQIIILLSDGMNTQDRWFGNDPNASQAVDNRMYNKGNGTGTCANAKAAGITIYAIQVNTDGDPTSTVMQNCASSADKFFMLTSANSMITTFNTIGTNLTKLRVAE
jgi:Flp pilus assembly protein TadG